MPAKETCFFCGGPVISAQDPMGRTVQLDTSAEVWAAWNLEKPRVVVKTTLAFVDHSEVCAKGERHVA